MGLPIGRGGRGTRIGTGVVEQPISQGIQSSRRGTSEISAIVREQLFAPRDAGLVIGHRLRILHLDMSLRCLILRLLFLRSLPHEPPRTGAEQEHDDPEYDHDPTALSAAAAALLMLAETWAPSAELPVLFTMASSAAIEDRDTRSEIVFTGTAIPSPFVASPAAIASAAALAPRIGLPVAAATAIPIRPASAPAICPASCTTKVRNAFTPRFASEAPSALSAVRVSATSRSMIPSRFGSGIALPKVASYRAVLVGTLNEIASLTARPCSAFASSWTFAGDAVALVAVAASSVAASSAICVSPTLCSCDGDTQPISTKIMPIATLIARSTFRSEMDTAPLCAFDAGKIVTEAGPRGPPRPAGWAGAGACATTTALKPTLFATARTKPPMSRMRLACLWRPTMSMAS